MRVEYIREARTKIFRKAAKARRKDEGASVEPAAGTVAIGAPEIGRT